MNTAPRVCLLGFGEVGQTLACDLLARGITDLLAWDIQFTNPGAAPRRAAEASAVRIAANPREAACEADVVVSAVTAAQDVAAAESMAEHLRPGTYFMDVNSVSPGNKRRVSEVVGRKGARYVEAVIMSPIAPRRLASPILLGGPHAAEFLPVARELGFSGAEVFAAELGRAAAAKMLRSVIVKGMEALLSESLVSARHYGVEGTVLESLRDLFPAKDWRELARYMISRSLIHGRRRAEEMREVAQTVRDAGVSPSMSLACVERQEWAAQFADAARCEDLDTMLDCLLPSSSAGPETC